MHIPAVPAPRDRQDQGPELHLFRERRAGPERRDLEIDAGESVLLVGRSGSGKSTVIKSINGLIPNRYRGRYEGEVGVMGGWWRGA